MFQAEYTALGDTLLAISTSWTAWPEKVKHAITYKHNCFILAIFSCTSGKVRKKNIHVFHRSKLVHMAGNVMHRIT